MRVGPWQMAPEELGYSVFVAIFDSGSTLLTKCTSIAYLILLNFNYLILTRPNITSFLGAGGGSIGVLVATPIVTPCTVAYIQVSGVPGGFRVLGGFGGGDNFYVDTGFGLGSGFIIGFGSMNALPTLNPTFGRLLQNLDHKLNN
jgi:hypothetical protein